MWRRPGARGDYYEKVPCLLLTVVRVWEEAIRPREVDGPETMRWLQRVRSHPLVIGGDDLLLVRTLGTTVNVYDFRLHCVFIMCSTDVFYVLWL